MIDERELRTLCEALELLAQTKKDDELEMIGRLLEYLDPDDSELLRVKGLVQEYEEGWSVHDAVVWADKAYKALKNKTEMQSFDGGER